MIRSPIVLLCLALMAACGPGELSLPPVTGPTPLDDNGAVLAAPGLVVDPAVVDFGDVRLGVPFGSADVVVRNVGQAPVRLHSVVVQGDPAFSVSGLDSAIVLGPASSHVLRVVFDPTADGVFQAALSIQSDDPAAATLHVPLTGRGVSAHLETLAPTIDFGVVAVGTAREHAIYLRNTGSAEAILVGSYIRGSSDFYLVGVSFPYIIPPGQAARFFVNYHPSRLGPGAGTLVLGASDSGLLIDLLGHGMPGGGTGMDTELVWTPSSPYFGPHYVGTTATRLLTVVNEGTIPRIITGVSIEANAHPVFTSTALPLLPFFLAPGSSVQFQVSFSPTDASYFTSSLTLTTTDWLKPFSTVVLTGDGMTPVFSAD